MKEGAFVTKDKADTSYDSGTVGPTRLQGLFAIDQLLSNFCI